MELRNKHYLEVMGEQIKTIVTAAEKLKRISGGVPAIDKNTDSILAFAHILEISLPDIHELDV